jgi:hypothetical protein
MQGCIYRNDRTNFLGSNMYQHIVPILHTLFLHKRQKKRGKPKLELFKTKHATWFFFVGDLQVAASTIIQATHSLHSNQSTLCFTNLKAQTGNYAGQPSSVMYHDLLSLWAQKENWGEQRGDDGEDHHRVGVALPLCTGLGVRALPAGGTCN